MIGGTDENVNHFRSHLPKAWQSLIDGTFPVSMNASQAEVMQRAMEIGRLAEQHREMQVVQALMTSAGKKRGGVVALGDTLRAVHDGRVLGFGRCWLEA